MSAGWGAAVEMAHGKRCPAAINIIKFKENVYGLVYSIYIKMCVNKLRKQLFFLCKARNVVLLTIGCCCCFVISFFFFLPLRLASTYDRRLKIRQVNVENTTQLNSPSEVEKDFRDFLDEERTEAWEIIENSLFSTRTDENDVKIRYLACMIFVVSNCAYNVKNNANCFSLLNLLHLSNTPAYERPIQ